MAWPMKQKKKKKKKRTGWLFGVGGWLSNGPVLQPKNSNPLRNRQKTRGKRKAIQASEGELGEANEKKKKRLSSRRVFDFEIEIQNSNVLGRRRRKFLEGKRKWIDHLGY